MSDYPSPREVADCAHEAVYETMKPIPGSLCGSLKSAPGEWFTDQERDPAHHLTRAIRHLTSAYDQAQGTAPEDGEGVVGHLRRAVTRCAFCLIIYARKGRWS